MHSAESCSVILCIFKAASYFIHITQVPQRVETIIPILQKHKEENIRQLVRDCTFCSAAELGIETRLIDSEVPSVINV